MKPRFPLSVERHFCYRAYLDNGCILESDSFKSVYRGALCELRCEIGECAKGWDTYNQTTSGFDFGYLTTYQIDDKHFYSEWQSIRKIGVLAVTSISEWFGSYEDMEHGFEFNRADYTERRG